MDNKVLVILNGRQITEKDLEETILKFPRERQSYLRAEDGKKQLLDEIISFELIYNYAKDNNIESDHNYLAQLEVAKKEILTQTAISKLLAEVTVEESEIENYYNNNKDMFKSEETVTAKHILVETLEKAQEIIKNIKEGISFEEAAKQYSICPSKSSGGDLGTFGKGSMVPEFEKAAFNLEVGVISEPVKTQFGYHIIKVEDRKPASIMKLDDVKNNIKARLLQENQRKRYVEFTTELKNKYPLEIK